MRKVLFKTPVLVVGSSMLPLGTSPNLLDGSLLDVTRELALQRSEESQQLRPRAMALAMTVMPVTSGLEIGGSTALDVGLFKTASDLTKHREAKRLQNRWPFLTGYQTGGPETIAVHPTRSKAGPYYLREEDFEVAFDKESLKFQLENTVVMYAIVMVASPKEGWRMV
ncbi:hypothetical protein FA13DRAFT_1723368 [Coprinellus micaceus]|uniref:Uncharacterized protein n=1 Tax=Coprinellus micaceus TaxID=71717 RepID=A0A4Y7R5T9_COPMI|nr:hypothetical protein FA13DRAFT_1723368 [Coprinellus micaceus]